MSEKEIEAWTCSRCGVTQRHEGHVCVECREPGREMLDKWRLPNAGIIDVEPVPNPAMVPPPMQTPHGSPKP